MKLAAWAAAFTIGLCSSGTVAGRNIIQKHLNHYRSEANAEHWSQSAPNYTVSLNNGAQATHLLYLIRNASTIGAIAPGHSRTTQVKPTLQCDRSEYILFYEDTACPHRVLAR